VVTTFWCAGQRGSRSVLVVQDMTVERARVEVEDESAAVPTVQGPEVLDGVTVLVDDRARETEPGAPGADPQKGTFPGVGHHGFDGARAADRSHVAGLEGRVQRSGLEVHVLDELADPEREV